MRHAKESLVRDEQGAWVATVDVDGEISYVPDSEARLESRWMGQNHVVGRCGRCGSSPVPLYGRLHHPYCLSCWQLKTFARRAPRPHR
jgi:hypothetical protein